MITEKQKGTYRPELYEMLTEIDKAEGREKQIEMIKKYSNYMCFLDWLRCVFDDRIQFILPEGKPPYTPCSAGAHPTSWHKEHLLLKLFVKGIGENAMGQLKREMKFIDILETIHPEDAVHVCDAMDKRHSTTLTKELVEEALPGLVS